MLGVEVSEVAASPGSEAVDKEDTEDEENGDDDDTSVEKDDEGEIKLCSKEDESRDSEVDGMGTGFVMDCVS